MEKTLGNYELLCLFLREKETKKEILVKKIQELGPKKFEKKKLNAENLETKYLESQNLTVDNYLLFFFTIDQQKIQALEKVLSEFSFFHYLLVNLQKEKS